MYVYISYNNHTYTHGGWAHRQRLESQQNIFDNEKLTSSSCAPDGVWPVSPDTANWATLSVSPHFWQSRKESQNKTGFGKMTDACDLLSTKL